MVANVGYRMVDQIRAKVIGFARQQMDRLIVLIQLGIPLIGQRAMEPVPAGKSSSQRSIVMRPCCAVICHIGEMPFADSIGPVGVVAKDFRNGCRLGSNLPLVSGIAA